MKHKPDAYTLEWNGKLNNIVKCDECAFKCVYAQIVDNDNKCPKCGADSDAHAGDKSPKGHITKKDKR